MHARTLATLDDLRSVSWFGRVGVRDTEAAHVVSSWAEAMESCRSEDWRDLRQEAVNQYHRRLQERSPQRRMLWNDLVAEIKPVTQALVKEHTEALITENRLPPHFRAAVEWDVLFCCMEAEYADVYPPGFYSSQAYWYVKGHFPCGWRGAFPAGKLVIY